MQIYGKGTGVLELGVAGDIVLGDSTERDMYPQTTLKINLGKSAAWFNEGYIDKLHVGWAEDNVSSPPTDAELDTAFGTPAAVGEGFVALLDDNNAATAGYLCASLGGAWWYATMTKAV
jgi:hypothetical protein